MRPKPRVKTKAAGLRPSLYVTLIVCGVATSTTLLNAQGISPRDNEGSSSTTQSEESPLEAFRAPRWQIGGTDLIQRWERSSGRFHIQTPQQPPPPSGMVPTSQEDKLSKAQSLLRKYHAQGRTAGLNSVLYDNRDRGHSPLPERAFPEMTRLTYGKAARRQGLNVGLADKFLFDRVTLGNSSTAYTGGEYPRSLPRAAMTGREGPTQAFRNYVNNHIYVYPEHLDHDALDKFPANWPYMVISQGSSSSDKPFVRTLAFVLSAMTPATFAYAQSENLIAPTLQMVLRRSQAQILSRASYLTGRAHPVVFNRRNLRPARAVALAQSLTPETLPPVVAMTVDAENFQTQAGLAELSEHLFTTPMAIGRLWRGFEHQKQMTLSAEALGGQNTEAAVFKWVLLQGDPARVTITPSGDRNQRAEVTLTWQPRYRAYRARSKTAPPTDRIDIAVFAATDRLDSAPSILSIALPTFQQRLYERAPDGKMRLRQIAYDHHPEHAPLSKTRGHDPVLFWRAGWTDVFRYDQSGHFTGVLRRYHSDAAPREITADGYIEDGRIMRYEIAKKPAAGEAKSADKLRYLNEALPQKE